MRIALYLLLLFLIFAIGIYFEYTRYSEIPATADRVTFYFIDRQQAVSPVVLKDPKSCQAFLDLLQSAKPADPHKSSHILTAEIDTRNFSKTLYFYIFLGSESKYFEFTRENKYRQFETEDFFKIPEIAERKSDFYFQ